MAISVSKAGHGTAGAATDNSSLEKLARLGYAARGIIYMLIGIMAAMAAIGQGGGSENTRGVLLAVLYKPGGWILVAVLALGLAGFGIWRFCQAVLDADSRGNDAKGIITRMGYFISGLAHVALAIWAGALAFGLSRGGGGQNSQESWIAWLMSQPFGRWLVGILGLVVIGVGVAQFLKGHHEKFERYLAWDQDVRRKLSPVCMFGLYARGVVFAIIGGFIVYAAYRTDPQQAGGLREALAWLRTQPYGPWLLGAVALGLVSFGVFSIVQAIYRRLNMPA